MAVRPPATRTPQSVTDDFRDGVAGFFERTRSLITGVMVTARAVRRGPVTVRYPAEKLTVSARWRGPLRLRGALGADTMPVLTGLPTTHNETIDGLYHAERLPGCVGNCPANVDARGQAYLIADDRVAEAYELVRERNIMPGVLGRICHHPCESACRRNHYDEPIATRPLHRFAFEEFQRVRPEKLTRCERTRQQVVAIIGSGPSGMAAAYDLLRLGYGVVMYESDEHPGGALRTGVPAYRLPREVLGREIEDIVEMGLDLKCGVEIGKDLPLGKVVQDHDAVLLAVGLQQSRILPLPGTDSRGVRGALEFLRAGNRTGDADVRGKRVFVIGGGNVAVDVARVALRVGASEVRLACLEGDDEMPCHPWEIAEALDEGVIATCSLGPDSVVSRDGAVVGMRMRACLSVFDETGRFAPKMGDEYTEFPCDVVVFAIGQAAKLDTLVAGTGLLVSGRGQLQASGTDYTTSVPGVFACGEVITGPGSAIASIATGHEAAISIDRYLSGLTVDDDDRVRRPVPRYPHYGPVALGDVEPDRRRRPQRLEPPDERVADFRPVEHGITRDEALREAARCLQCGSEVCVGCTFCARTCPDLALTVARDDTPGSRCVATYEMDLTKCCFCGLCAEQCPTNALVHTGQYELSFYHREYTTFDVGEMLRSGEGTRATGRDGAPADACAERAEGEEAR